MLSSQTKDEVTDAAVDKLRVALGGTLSLEGLLDAEEDVVAGCISKVGFWRRKTQSVPPFFFSPTRGFMDGLFVGIYGRQLGA